jgi:sugar lactone lactonase YvrE
MAQEDCMHTRHLTVGIGLVLLLAGVLMAISAPSMVSAAPPIGEPTATRLVTGLEGAVGSTIGPDGALYVTEGIPGRIARVDPHTGAITTFASGLPKRVNPDSPFGGAVDVAFLGKTAYVLVTLVSPDVGGSDVDGIYRVDGTDRVTLVADIGEFNVHNPPTIPFPFEARTGVQYALQTYRGGFLVTDGHLNRVLRVTRDGEITVSIAFDDIVPTGLTVSKYLVYMAEAGPVPHRPEDGKVVAFGPKASTATEVASGAPLLVDVEFGPHGRLYALSQGDFPPGAPEGSPALPNTGALVKVNGDGTFTVIIDGLDRPSSLEFIGNTAYVITLTGEIWKIDHVSGRPSSASR